jgi:hypothetical protein
MMRAVKALAAVAAIGGAVFFIEIYLPLLVAWVQR